MRDVSAQVLCLSATPPLIKKARILHARDDGMELDLGDPEAALQEGMHVVLAGDAQVPFRIMGVVTSVKGSRVQVRAERRVESDKRDFPRLQGGLCVRYRVLGKREAPEAVEAWLAGGPPSPGEGPWNEPDPFMDFSSSGLRFDDRLICEVGDRVLLEMQVPPSGEKWRVAADVVRVTPVLREEAEDQDDEARKRGPTHHIAVRFERLPGGASEALAAFALRIQDALLNI